jgi:hypothetical protein
MGALQVMNSDPLETTQAYTMVVRDHGG